MYVHKYAGVLSKLQSKNGKKFFCPKYAIPGKFWFEQNLHTNVRKLNWNCNSDYDVNFVALGQLEPIKLEKDVVPTCTVVHS